MKMYREEIYTLGIMLQFFQCSSILLHWDTTLWLFVLCGVLLVPTGDIHSTTDLLVAVTYCTETPAICVCTSGALVVRSVGGRYLCIRYHGTVLFCCGLGSMLVSCRRSLSLERYLAQLAK